MDPEVSAAIERALDAQHAFRSFPAVEHRDVFPRVWARRRAADQACAEALRQVVEVLRSKLDVPIALPASAGVVGDVES